MIRSEYNWNAKFPGDFGGLDWMFIFSALGGDLNGEKRLLSSWIADWRRMYDVPAGGRPGLTAPNSGVNMAMRFLSGHHRSCVPGHWSRTGSRTGRLARASLSLSRRFRR